MTPKSWYDKTIGKKIDTDNYPRTNPYQCWDYFDYFCRQIGFTGSRYCASTGYVGDLWLLRDADGYNYSSAFDYITDPSQFKTGDWVFWKTHVAMYYNGMELGQNQPSPYVTLKSMNWNGVLGAMRWKGWESVSIAYGASDIELNGHKYALYRMCPNEEYAVLGAGLHELKNIRDFDIDADIYAKVGGLNFFQNDRNNKAGQPYGMTFGDISSPLTGEYQSLPNQDSTLFYDMEDGTFGDCTYHEVDPTHNVYSPALVFPNINGHFEYARMVGYAHKDTTNWYTFIIKFNDGYCFGKALQQMTPQQIADDFNLSDMENIAFLDGGGSAQFGRWNGTKFEYIGSTDRPLPSIGIIYRRKVTPPVEEKPVEEGKENEPMSEPNEMTPVEGWKDPETTEPIIVQRIAALLSVKSLITIALTVAFIILVVNGKELPDQFVSIYTMCISFFFGYQFKKAEGKE